MNAKETLKKAICAYLYKQAKIRSLSFYNNAIKYNPQLKEFAEGEEEWLKKWRQFDSKLTPIAYRVFSRYIGPNMNIVPLEGCWGFCEPLLTPANYIDFYSDKNSFDLLFPEDTLPKTILRKVKGRWFDNNYTPLDNINLDTLISNIEFEEIIVKPALSSSGKGVEKFSKTQGPFINGNKEILNSDFLNKYYCYDCIIQQAFTQHSFFSQFNTSSVNSIRIATYRDSKGMIHPLNSFLRIGALGSVVDNAHAGGMFVGIDKDGVMGEYACDQFGRKSAIFNGIDFSKEEFQIPCWKEIQEKMVSLTKYVIHHDLIQWDAILDENGISHILEVNVGGYGGWAFQFTSGPMFGDYTDDVMGVITENMKNSELKISFYKKH